MESPKEIIENISKIRFRIGWIVLTFRKIYKQIYKTVMNLKMARQELQVNSFRNPHFILELIQNAEDNEYEDNVNPDIKFIILNDKIKEGDNEPKTILIIQNNEKV
jgi:sacsin